MITFKDPEEKMKDVDKSLDSQLWHACAGGMVQMPPVNSKVFYFPQGHAEHAYGSFDFKNCPKIPAYIACRVCAVKFMADPETDEVYAKIRLLPISSSSSIGNERDCEDDGTVGVTNNVSQNQEKPSSFAKTLTQSDANNGGGFSVPRYCAETIFPRLDYSADPPVQTILAKDVHGETWKFRHIYRGTPRRHLLTTGWSTFVNHKKLVAGDSIVFLRAENGDLCVGIRRAKRGIGGGGQGSPSSSGWTPAGGNCAVPYGGCFSAFLREDENRVVSNGSVIGKGGKVRAECVVEAVNLAANSQPFEVVYCPRASTPEFCVKAPLVKAALQIRWCSGMRFKMAFETEDSSRISWFMGTISSVQVADAIRWPDSPWRLLQVTWDEPDLLQNVKRVSPWLVELVSNLPAIHLSPFSPPRKKLRLLPQHPDFPHNGQLPMPTFSGSLLGPSNNNNPFSCLTENTPVGMQGARHNGQYGSSFTDFHLNKLHSGVFAASGFPPARAFSTPIIHKSTTITTSNEDVSCVLMMGNSATESKKSGDVVKTPPHFLLFGQPIHTEQQISLTCSGGGDNMVSPVLTGNSSTDGNLEKMASFSDGSGRALHHLHGGGGFPEQSSCEGYRWYKDNRSEIEPNLEIGHCKVFMESEDVGRTLDLSSLGSYEELYRRLANMFGLEDFVALNHVLYRDTTGTVKHVGQEPFSDFMRSARRLTILMESSSDNVGM